MDWMELLLPIIRDVVIVVVLAAAGYALKFWRNIQMEAWIKELIVDAVLFVQEKYWDLSGEDKFAQAKVWIVEQLNKRGIQVDDEWLDAVIDAVVKELRAEFGDEDWYRQGG